MSEFLTQATPVRARHQVRLVKGSHIVVPRLFAHRFAYIFQNEDRRIVFAIPYEHDFTLLGTTDLDYRGDPAAVAIAADETRYLCSLANRYFRRQIAPESVVWSYSGVRPLLADEASDPMSVTRDYALELDRVPAPLLSVFGGKITTYRRLAEDAVDLLHTVLGERAPPGPPARCCPVATCPRAVSRSSCARWSAATAGCPRSCAGAMPTRTARASRASWAGRPRSPSSAPRCSRALRAGTRVPVP